MIKCAITGFFIGYIPLLRRVCDVLINSFSDQIDDTHLQKLVKSVKSSEPNPVAAAVHKELLRFSNMKKQMHGFGSPSSEPMQAVAGCSKTTKRKRKKHPKRKSGAAYGEKDKVNLSSKVRGIKFSLASWCLTVI